MKINSKTQKQHLSKKGSKVYEANFYDTYKEGALFPVSYLQSISGDINTALREINHLPKERRAIANEVRLLSLLTTQIEEYVKQQNNEDIKNTITRIDACVSQLQNYIKEINRLNKNIDYQKIHGTLEKILAEVNKQAQGEKQTD